MPARVVALSLVLAGPALAAPPLSPTIDNAAIHDEINAADPWITANPAPIERLVAVAELAEARLEASDDLDDVADLLTLAVTARKVAYQRTGAGVHLCRVLAAAEHVLARSGLSMGLAVTGWGRNLQSIMRLVLTRWFTAEGEAGPVRIEPTTTDAVGFAVGEDREGKLIVVGALHQPKTDANAWIFAVPGPMGAPVWEVVRNGPGQGPDEAAGLAIDPWGYSYVVGSEFDALQPRAFALRLYP